MDENSRNHQATMISMIAASHSMTIVDANLIDILPRLCEMLAAIELPTIPGERRKVGVRVLLVTRREIRPTPMTMTVDEKNDDISQKLKPHPH
jgi:hypothetical protein